MKAFVTGSTGLLGSNLTQLLLTQGYEVLALARDLSKARRVLGEHPNLKFVQGDMQDIPAFVRYLKGCDVLFHTAAYFRESFGLGEHWSKLKAINIDATILLLEVAEAAGVAKVIYVSSSGAIGLTPDGSPSNESTPPSALNYENLYFKSKVMGEDAIANFLKTHNLPVILILPGAMFGPGDAAPTEAGQFVVDFLNSKVPFVMSGGFSVVDPRDVAQAMVAAVQLGQSGERYLVAGRFHSVEEIMQTLARFGNRSVPKIKLPGFAMHLVARMFLIVGWLAGKKPDLTINAVKIMLSEQRFDSSKAVQAFKVPFRPLAETLKDMVVWYEQNGYVR